MDPWETLALRGYFYKIFWSKTTLRYPLPTYGKKG